MPPRPTSRRISYRPTVFITSGIPAFLSTRNRPAAQALALASLDHVDRPRPSPDTSGDAAIADVDERRQGPFLVLKVRVVSPRLCTTATTHRGETLRPRHPYDLPPRTGGLP